MRWSNVPVPEPHLAVLIGGFVLHAIVPVGIPLATTVRRVVGAPMVVAGAGFAAWAVASAADAEIDRDSALVTAGAYRLSRNPMYLGWSAAVLGVALMRNSLWLLAGWLLAIRSLDREINVEESRLLRRFGATYEAYRTRVPRCLPISVR